MTKEFKEGYDARLKERCLVDCPYTEDPQKDEWEIGWLSAENDALQSEYCGGDPTRLI